MKKKLEELTLSCMRCGNCQPVCPVFREIGEEGASPRGRVRLIRGVAHGEIELSARYQELLGLCINCRACAEECPSGLEPNIAILNARQQTILEKGLPAIKRLIFRCAMRARRMFPASAKLLGLLQRATLIGNPWSPARLVLPAMGIPIDKAIPYFALKPFLDRVPEINPVENPSRLRTGSRRRRGKHRVAYFVGCSANLLYPEIGEAVVGLMNHFGVEVVIPKDQMCCGTPIFNAGDFEGGAYLAKHNLRIFSELDVDAIITACGSCGLALKQEWRNLLGMDVPEAFSAKILDFTEFLSREISDFGFRISDLKLTYHDSCHLARGMGVRSQPRELLTSIPGVELIEMAEADKCCGGGGAFSLYHPELSRQVGDRKAENAMGTRADAIVTGCPSCVMQLREMLARHGSAQAVRHTACVLWQAVPQ